MKVKNLVSGIVSFLVCSVIILFIFYFNANYFDNWFIGWSGAIKNIVYIPTMIILLIVSCATNVSCLFNSLEMIPGSTRTIKIISIVLLVLSVVLVFANFYNVSLFLHRF